MKLSILMGLSALSLVACTAEKTAVASPNTGGAAATTSTSTSEVTLTLKRNP